MSADDNKGIPIVNIHLFPYFVCCHLCDKTCTKKSQQFAHECGLIFYMNYLQADNSNEIISLILSLNEIFSPKVALIVRIIQLIPLKKQHFFEQV